MGITVVKEFTFDAAHHLPNYPGKCQNLHGHTYRLQIGIKGPINPVTGMVVDFAKIKEIIRRVILDYLDHKCLNEIKGDHFIAFPRHNPTAELMVSWIVQVLIRSCTDEKLGSSVKLNFVRLYETPTSYAEWRRCEC